jgi:hypothetical protein
MSQPDPRSIDKLRRLLALEKERRGVAQTDVIFINTATIAKHSAARPGSNEYTNKARNNELGFFNEYRGLRIDYARRFGLVDVLPTNPTEYLLVGEEITYEQVEAANPLPDTLNSERLSEEGVLTLRDKHIGRARSLTSFAQGDLAYEVFAEEYSAFKWYFPWEGRVVIGVPDGLTKDSVYEFKSTMKPLYKQERAKQAIAQADIYGLFFRRANRRVQGFCWEDATLSTVDSPVDTNTAATHLSGFCARL